MELLFEISKSGRRGTTLPQTINKYTVPTSLVRQKAPRLPEVAEVDLVRHYIKLSQNIYSVDTGFYPLGSCTMKYNPRLNNDLAVLFNNLHPYQSAESVQGSLQAIQELEDSLAQLTGMDAISLQPAAGAQGELTSLLMIKAYHQDRGDYTRTKVIVPDSAHGTNPASGAMAGYDIITLPSNEKGAVDVMKLKELMDDTVAALMLTNPNTVGIFDENILEITDIVHQRGGLVYYDGANLNAIMGRCRPKDMGFDVVHLNLHKTFSTPHGGGGPGSGPIGCTTALSPFLPKPTLDSKTLTWNYDLPKSIGKMRTFYGNFQVYIRALAYIKMLGRDGLKQASENAVLNANYMMHKLKDTFLIPFGKEGCMHEFVLSLTDYKDKYGVNAKDFSKALLDYNIHPPTMYFPLIVPEALMVEPTETESKETLDKAIAVFKEIAAQSKENPEAVLASPKTTIIKRVDEVKAARNPILRYQFKEEE